MDLVRAQQRVWAYEAASRDFVLSGPDTPVGCWPLPRQTRYRRLRESLEQARRQVEQHPVMAAAIADRRWAAAARALARAAQDDPQQAAA
ncbi:hypothetical protein GXW83_25585 [Streptacidiphilus sp. PB12-B1b]|uniref:hypothetical protein n=1 Tax=Streptacidiphilus sp. PB12-B1b TaxID=2705012 RepID=UPI0015FC34D1|nr:hypothetical protein [Streptacidiphilus sp. PB12-B1b]QMU78577.1 hypothetical protein GXW83_25585 [Streptacidiphilus sp. PB12-B1b]